MYTRIIVAVDLTQIEQGKALLTRALALLDAGGEVRLVHALEDVPAYVVAELPRDIGERRLAEARVELRDLAHGLDQHVEIEVRHGSASNQILEAAQESGADLIMIASHRPGLSDYFIGSTAARVVRHAQCSVLTSR
ncbi:universal stress protein [Roseicitreum antarcticum]|uniref:Nucleotide-binding universal stress protein, UspA family n=1 Tax=Roseicitreum antarcticum TaxID=564137 RepID=A0A1H3CEC8_9RHOB|nr:universal stress protein [Roseicitreum antarcticum]SDX52445.1 Nucleotide-binding universal stress protein, UspA family [Roseicitreum antarcticum]